MRQGGVLHQTGWIRETGNHVRSYFNNLCSWSYIYQDFGARSSYLWHGEVIKSHSILWDVITCPCHRYLLLMQVLICSATFPDFIDLVSWGFIISVAHYCAYKYFIVSYTPWFCMYIQFCMLVAVKMTAVLFRLVERNNILSLLKET